MLNPAPEAFEESRGATPQVFVRVFGTPPGPPWEQARAARLEARHGAPLPIAELVHRLRRMGSWAPGSPGRFAVFYVRAREFAAPFETTVEVDGQPVRVAFGSAAEQLRRAQGLATIGLICGAALLVLGIGVALALNARAEASGRLEIAEQTLAAKRRAALLLQKRADQARDLQVAVGKAAPLATVFADLRWAAGAKAPDARIDAVHWDHGLLAVESRGEAAPFLDSDRRLQRSARPIRRGEWLWGVLPAGAPAQGIAR